MTKKQYIEGKIRDFRAAYAYMGYLTGIADQDLARRWRDEERRANQKWQAIASIDDLRTLVERFDGAVRFVETRVTHSTLEDGFNMALACYNAITGFEKLAAMSIFAESAFGTLTECELDALFVRMSEIAERMSAANLHRAEAD